MRDGLLIDRVDGALKDATICPAYPSWWQLWFCHLGGYAKAV